MTSTDPEFVGGTLDRGRGPEGAAPLACAGAVIALAVALCLRRIDVPFGYDESVTVGAFVKADSFLDATTSQIVANNHQAMSAVSHLIWRLSGSTSETTLRILPTIFFASAAGLLTWASARRFSWIVGLTAGVVLTTNPMVFGVSRSIRGYGLMMLCAVGATLLLVRSTAGDPQDRRGGFSYLAVAVIGTSAQLYMLLVLVGHAAWCWRDRRLRAARWHVWPVAGATIGVALQLPLLMTTLEADRGRVFRPDFPIDVAEALLGSAPIAVLASTLLLAMALPEVRKRPELIAAIATIGTVALAVWVVAPADLYTRFFVGLSPAIALGTALGARRISESVRGGPAVAAALVVAVLAGQTTVSMTDVGITEYANREASTAINAAMANGLDPCVLSTSSEALMGYQQPRTIRSAPEADGCDLVISLVPKWDNEIFPDLGSRFRHVMVLDSADTTGRIFTDAPLACLEDDAPACAHD